MLTKPSKTVDENLAQGRMLTEEEDHEMKENLARRNFGCTASTYFAGCVNRICRFDSLSDC